MKYAVLETWIALECPYILCHYGTDDPVLFDTKEEAEEYSYEHAQDGVIINIGT
jgi:hypothetical protein